MEYHASGVYVPWKGVLLGYSNRSTDRTTADATIMCIHGKHWVDTRPTFYKNIDLSQSLYSRTCVIPCRVSIWPYRPVQRMDGHSSQAKQQPYYTCIITKFSPCFEIIIVVEFEVKYFAMAPCSGDSPLGLSMRYIPEPPFDTQPRNFTKIAALIIDGPTPRGLCIC